MWVEYRSFMILRAVYTDTMACNETDPITRCLVNTITVSVKKNRAEYAVEHGVTDLNYPDESYPRVFERTDTNAPIPAGDFTGSASVFALANAFIEQYTRKTVPSHHDSASNTSGVSHMYATARVEMSDEIYRLTFDTTVPVGQELPFLSASITSESGEKQDSVALDDIPKPVFQRGREVVDQTVDR